MQKNIVTAFLAASTLAMCLGAHASDRSAVAKNLSVKEARLQVDAASEKDLEQHKPASESTTYAGTYARVLEEAKKGGKLVRFTYAGEPSAKGFAVLRDGTVVARFIYDATFK